MGGALGTESVRELRIGGIQRHAARLQTGPQLRQRHIRLSLPRGAQLIQHAGDAHRIAHGNLPTVIEKYKFPAYQREDLATPERSSEAM